ncbi:MAG: hypothetical protein A3G18_03675 [Rhodospirillales bacterium RIFCSPLOWO2_12_FULL_58_28]|nr:MAG: hypothetical protein A3H92_00945 [Rhodospirillales bacterium RIFCSPLOWO2_02_FULL_58_16]OHC76862.1 MAG: hypothetical protein A3G18_03675 [Rhodospirillales bacterium RIFCSPLOWO2_12_FULL_58_28]
MRKKVLFVSYALPPFGGGGEQVARNVLSYLSENDLLELEVLTAADIHSGLSPDSVENVKFHTVPTWRKSRADTGIIGMLMFVMLGACKLRKLLKKNNYDLVHYWASVPSGLLSFLHHGDVPYVISLFGGDVPKFNSGQYQLLHFLLAPFNKSIVRNAAAVVAMSRAAKTATEKELGPANIKVIWNAADDLPADARAVIDRDKQTLRLISVGRLVGWKRFNLVISAVGGCDDVELVIVGDGPERKSLENLVEKTCSGRVQFLGMLNKAQVSDELLKSDVFVLPSIGESFGNVFVEAMACGLPVIGARAGGVAEIIENEKNGFLIEPDNLGELIDRINFFKNADERKRMSEESIGLFKEKFTWPRVFEKYQAVYKEMHIGWR